MTAVTPVAGRREKSSAMMAALPRRKAYGEAHILPTRTGISRSTRPRWLSTTMSTGSGRPARTRQRPSALRGTFLRMARPAARRSARFGRFAACASPMPDRSLALEGNCLRASVPDGAARRHPFRWARRRAGRACRRSGKISNLSRLPSADRSHDVLAHGERLPWTLTAAPDRRGWQPAQSDGGSRQRAVLRPGTWCGGWTGPLVADRLAGADAAAVLGAAAGAGRRAARRGSARAGQRVRTVRRGGGRHARAGRADQAAGGRRALPLRPQPDVPGGRRGDRRAGACPGPAGAAAVRGGRRRGHGRLRRRLRGADAGPPVRRAVRGLPARRACLVAPLAPVGSDRRRAALTAAQLLGGGGAGSRWASGRSAGRASSGRSPPASPLPPPP